MYDLFSICCAPDLSSSSSSSAISSVMYGSTMSCRAIPRAGRCAGGGRGRGISVGGRGQRSAIASGRGRRDGRRLSSSYPGTVQAVGLRRGSDSARNDRRGATNGYGSRYAYSSDARALLEHCIELTARRLRVRRATVAGGVCARDNRWYTIYRVNAGTAAAAESYVLSSARVRINALCVRSYDARALACVQASLVTAVARAPPRTHYVNYTACVWPPRSAINLYTIIIVILQFQRNKI